MYIFAIIFLLGALTCYIAYKSIIKEVTVINVRKLFEKSLENPEICSQCLCIESTVKISIIRVLLKAIFAALAELLKTQGYYCQTIHCWLLGEPIQDGQDLPAWQLLLQLLRGLLARMFLLPASACLILQEWAIRKSRHLLLNMTESPQGLCQPHHH